ncbi:MAG TPA: Uma2 family endonuclease [Rubrobacter sp.]|nr:Uma2 family endonuclease [Rubrobacter sp.]
MAVTHEPVTAEELLEIPNDGLRRELVRGEVRTMAPAGYQHGRIAQNMAASLDRLAREKGVGVVLAAETGFKLARNSDTVRAADVAFVARERAEAAGEVPGYWPGAPDLAVEVVSANDRFAEVEEKVADWLAAGTRMVVVANPQGRTATVRPSEKEARILSEGEVLDGGEVVPGWTLPVADVFR